MDKRELNEFDESFKDVDAKNPNTKYYIMIFILYLMVIGLVIIVILGIQARGKDIIDKSNENSSIEDKKDDTSKSNTKEQQAMMFVNSIENSLRTENFNATKCSILSMKVVCLNDTDSKSIDVNSNISITSGYFDVVDKKATNGKIVIDSSTIIIENGVYMLDSNASMTDSDINTNDTNKSQINSEDYRDLDDMRGLLQ